jgi:hypothetical protein
MRISWLRTRGYFASAYHQWQAHCDERFYTVLNQLFCRTNRVEHRRLLG